MNLKRLLSLRLVKDTHIGPHPMKDGACHCDCDQCCVIAPATPERQPLYICVCRRCNQDCTGFGRFGNPQDVRDERDKGYPYKIPGWKTASRWYWTHRYYGKRRK